jgi:hypothetical protein
MTDDSEENRPKLRLSKETAPQQSEEADASPASPLEPAQTPEPTEPTEPAEPKLKLNLAGTTFSETQSIKEKELEKEKLAESNFPPPHQLHEPKDEPARPPKLPTAVDPNLQRATDQKIDRNLDKLEQSGNGSNLLAGALIVIVLCLIFGGASIGIWWVLNQPSEGQTVEETASESYEIDPFTDDAVQAAGPIQRTKETIALIPSIEIEELVGVDQATPETTLPSDLPTSETPTAGVSTSEALTSEAPVETVEPAQAAPEIDTSTQKTVTAFLAEAHIDGVRSGNNPKVMIGGNSFLTGDELDNATGLTFQGINNGKLIFKDRNGVLYVKSF